MSKKKKPAMSPAAFGVKSKSEEGVKLPLYLPDGTETAEHLLIRGQDSPTFRKAQARYNRDVGALRLRARGSAGKKKENKPLDPGDVAMQEENLFAKLITSLVVGWSFSEERADDKKTGREPFPFTPENLLEWLIEAPQIQEQINAAANQRERFFEKPQSHCEPTQESSSGSISD